MKTSGLIKRRIKNSILLPITGSSSSTNLCNSYFSIVKFRIVIRHDGKYIRLNVERIYLSDELEKYKITARNKTLTLQSNRPLLKAKGLKNKKPDWKVVEGQIHNSHIVTIIIEAMQPYIKMEEKKMGGGG